MTILIVLLIYLIPRLIGELNRLTILMPRYIGQLRALYLTVEERLNNVSWSEEFNHTIQNIFQQLDIFPQLTEKIQILTQGIISKLSGTIIIIVKAIFNFVLSIIVSFYFLKDREVMQTKFAQTVPKKYHKQVFHFLRDVNDVLSAFIRGQLTVCLIIGVVTFIGLTIMGIDFALLIAIIAGVTNLIPYFGPVIGAIPGIVVGAMQSPWMSLKVLIFFVVVQQIDGNIITPKIVGDKVGFHPVLVILVLLIGGQWKGVLGMLLAIPVAAVIKVTLRHVGMLVTKKYE
jgi:predicted PurR-regulated permease PerM